ncbi:hypothetical protein ACI6Q2_18195 [Chitinophagaceae bacterium LWZ2-11]
MLSKVDFLEQYKKYSEEQLIELYTTIEDYSDEAKEAFYIVVAKRGGVESLIAAKKGKELVAAEIGRINNLVSIMKPEELDLSFPKELITSEILSKEDLHKVVDEAYQKRLSALAEKKIDAKSIVTAIIAGLSAGTVGGILFGVQLIFTGVIMRLLFIALVLICYGITTLIARKSYKNTAVLIATIFAVILSLIIGDALFKLIGYHG